MAVSCSMNEGSPSHEIESFAHSRRDWAVLFRRVRRYDGDHPRILSVIENERGDRASPGILGSSNPAVNEQPLWSARVHDGQRYDLTLMIPVSTARTTCTSDCPALALAVCWSIAGTHGAGSLLYRSSSINPVVTEP
jgi:hypothetical protein